MIGRIRPDDPRWAAYVRSHPRATAYHLPGMVLALRDAFRWTDASLALERPDGTLAGVLPLVAHRGRATGRRLRSLPVLPGGGPVADTVSDEALLLAAAQQMGAARGFVTWVRSRTPGLADLAPALTSAATPPTWILDVPDDPDAWLRERSKRLVRGVRRAEKDGVVVRAGRGEADLRAWHALYVETMRRHRSPPRSLRSLTAAAHHLGDAFRLIVAERDGRVIAGGIFHVFNGTVELLYNASDRGALEHRPNHALYAYVTRWAREQGLAKFDFGGAWPADTLATFKAQWGAVEVPEYLYTDGPAEPPPPADAPAPAPAEEPAAPPSALQRAIGEVWDRAPSGALARGSELALRWL